MAPPRGARVEARLAGQGRYGLIPSAGTATAPERWVGFSWSPESCGIATPADITGCGAPTPLVVPDSPDIREYEPIGLWAGEKCSPWDRGRDWQGRARRQLQSAQSYQLEREFWTGTLAQAQGYPNAYLASAGADTLSGGALAPLDALACLEEGIARATAGSRGMIHATPATVTHWANGGALRREGNQILTVLDTIVVPGSGYPGSSPAGVAAANGSVWAYGTEMVDVRLGDIFFVPEGTADSLERRGNTIEQYAWRAAAASWDGCAHVAVELNISACGI